MIRKMYSTLDSEELTGVHMATQYAKSMHPFQHIKVYAVKTTHTHTLECTGHFLLK